MKLARADWQPEVDPTPPEDTSDVVVIDDQPRPEHGVAHAWRDFFVDMVAARHRVPVEAILSKSRRREVVRARDELAWRLRETGLALPAVGDLVGYADHTSAMMAIRRHQAWLDAARAREAEARPAQGIPELAKCPAAHLLPIGVSDPDHPPVGVSDLEEASDG